MTDFHRRIGAALDRRQAQAEVAMPHFLALFGDLPEPLADFLAAHDPPSVLRQVEADRRVLARHASDFESDGYCCECENRLAPCPDLLDLGVRYEVEP
jgi:hypothetical protein